MGSLGTSRVVELGINRSRRLRGARYCAQSLRCTSTQRRRSNRSRRFRGARGRLQSLRSTRRRCRRNRNTGHCRSCRSCRALDLVCKDHIVSFRFLRRDDIALPNVPQRFLDHLQVFPSLPPLSALCSGELRPVVRVDVAWSSGLIRHFDFLSFAPFVAWSGDVHQEIEHSLPSPGS